MGTVSTSIVERANLDIRTTVRQFTRLTSACSKNAENHAQVFSLCAMVYNFCWPHGTLSGERGINTMSRWRLASRRSGHGRYWRWWSGWTRRGKSLSENLIDFPLRNCSGICIMPVWVGESRPVVGSR